MTLRAFTVRFGPVDVHATSEYDALEAAATLIRADFEHYASQVRLWDDWREDGTLPDTTTDTPDDGKETTT